jgi:chorismate mutase / prephenate dehydratase
MDLATLRGDIDRIDDEILTLLNERARLVAHVAALKERMQVPFYVPSRERAIVDRLAARNEGPFPSEAIRPVFQEIFSACLSLEKTVRVAYLGPEATFTHMAVKRQFGLSARAIPVGTIGGVFEEVARGGADFGVVPVENSTEGVVNHTLDTFLGSELKISAEIVLEVNHCLLVRSGLELAHVDRVFSHPQALAQCRRWLSTNLPRAVVVEAGSTSEAARLARDDPHGAAIASELAARLYDMTIARRNLADVAHNVTRFLVIGDKQAVPTGRDRTSILLELADQPGILFKVLEPFARRGVNMSKIESRPSRRRPWEYVFFVDVDGHHRDAAVADGVEDVRALCTSLKVLGSYPKAESL